MNKQAHNRTVAYILIAIIIVIALGTYVYIMLKQAPPENNPPAAMTPVATNQVVLTPEEANAKAAILDSLTSKSPQQMTQAQVSAKESALANLEKKGK